MDSIQRAKKVKEKCVPAIVKAVERGDVTVSAAAALSKRPKAEQQALIDAGPVAVKEAASVARGKKLSAATEGSNQSQQSSESTQLAINAIMSLKRIPSNDTGRMSAYEMVENYIIENRPSKCLERAYGAMELRDMFDTMEAADDDAVAKFAEWALSQSNVETIHEGCTAWSEWRSERNELAVKR